MKFCLNKTSSDHWPRVRRWHFINWHNDQDHEAIQHRHRSCPLFTFASRRVQKRFCFLMCEDLFFNVTNSFMQTKCQRTLAALSLFLWIFSRRTTFLTTDLNFTANACYARNTLILFIFHWLDIRSTCTDFFLRTSALWNLFLSVSDHYNVNLF